MIFKNQKEMEVCYELDYRAYFRQHRWTIIL